MSLPPSRIFRILASSVLAASCLWAAFWLGQRNSRERHLVEQRKVIAALAAHESARPPDARPLIQSPAAQENPQETAAPLDSPSAAEIEAPTLASAVERWQRAQLLPLGLERHNEMISALEDLSKWDPDMAVAEAKGIEELNLRRDALEGVIKALGKQNPEEGWRLLSDAPEDGSLPGDRIEHFLEGLGDGNPQAALEFFASHAQDLARHRGHVEEVLNDIYEKGGHDLLQNWVGTLPDGQMKDAAVNRLIDQWALYDPQASKAWMESQPISAENRAQANIELATSWARVRPLEAVDWVHSLPPAQQSHDLYDAVFRRWIEYDRNGAAAWLANQPSAPLLDRPIERYTAQVMEIDPANSMPWAESITDQGRRFRMMNEIAERWGRNDPQALSNYVAPRDFTPQQKERLLRHAQPRRQ